MCQSSTKCSLSLSEECNKLIFKLSGSCCSDSTDDTSGCQELTEKFIIIQRHYGIQHTKVRTHDEILFLGVSKCIIPGL